MVFKHYRTLLSSENQMIYDILYTGIKELNKAIKFPSIEENDLQKIMNYLFLDNPVFFYFRQYSYVIYSNETVLTPNYLYSDEQIKLYLNEIGRLTKVFKNTKGLSDYDFILYINGLFKKKVVYNNDESFECHSIVGSLIRKSAVCDAISKLFKYVCDLNNIPCIVVEGNAKTTYNSPDYGGHAWNKVFVDGSWSHLDLTYNMTTGSTFVRHDYCFLTDEEMASSHTMDHDDKLLCNDKTLNVFRRFNLVMNNQTDLKEYIKKCLEEKRDMLEFKLPKAKNIEEAIDKVVNVTEKAMIEKNIARAFKVEYNLDQLIFFILFK